MQFFTSGLIESIGLTIIDTVWQGLLIGLGLFLILTLTGIKAPAIRYRMSMLALVTMFVWAGYSFANHYQESLESARMLVGVQQIPGAGYGDMAMLPENAVAQNGLISLLHDFLHPYTSLLTGIWICGILFLYIRLSGGLIYISRLKTSSRVVKDPVWLNKISELSKRIGVNRVTRLLESTMISSPVTMGFLRPVIILPTGMLTGIPTAQLESILVHELVHIKKADYLVNIFQSLVEIILFYHPATWYISFMIRKERENRCDQITVGLIDNPVSYARALTTIGENSIYRAPKLAIPAHSGKGDLTRRICSILNLEDPKPRRNRVVAALLVLLLSVSFFSFYKPEQATPKESLTIEANSEVHNPEEAAQPRNHKGTSSEQELAKALLREQLDDLRDKLSNTPAKNPVEKVPGLLLKGPTTFLINKTDTLAPPRNNRADIEGKSPENQTQNQPIPVFYVDGQKVNQEYIKHLVPSMVKKVEVLKGQNAIERFGKEGGNGVVLITTAQPLLDSIRNDGNFEKEKQQQESIIIYSDQVRADSGNIRLDGNVNIQSVDAGPTEAKPGAKLYITTDNYSEDPLLVVDGKVSGSSLSSLDEDLSPEEIHSVNVLRGPSAVAIYGERGVHGVVLVTTKKKSESMRSDTTMAAPDFIPDPFSIPGNAPDSEKDRPDVSEAIPDTDKVGSAVEPASPGTNKAEAETDIHEAKTTIGETKADLMGLRVPEIYPNPSSGVFNIRFNLDHRSKVGVQVYDLNGKLIDKVFRKSLNEGVHNITWEAGNVPAGSYVVHFTVGKQTVKQQIMVER